MIPGVVYNRRNAEEDVYSFTAVVEWEDDVNEIPEMLNDTVNTTLKGPDLDITVSDTYSDGIFLLRNSFQSTLNCTSQNYQAVLLCVFTS